MQGVLHVDPAVRNGLLGTSVISLQRNVPTRVEHHQMEAETPKPAAVPIQAIRLTYNRIVQDRYKSSPRVGASQEALSANVQADLAVAFSLWRLPRIDPTTHDPLAEASPSMCTARANRKLRLRATVDLPAPGIPVINHASRAGGLMLISVE
jgi:hypothetical protein